VKRVSGILLHITSLPSQYGIGDLGKEAYKFVDFLRDTRQSLWQILPLNPTESFYANSPYHGTSAFAGNTLLISPELLFEEGLLEKGDLQNMPQFSEDKVDFESVIPFKKQLFEKAFEKFKVKNHSFDFEEFCFKNAQWLDDFALFVSLKDKFGVSWGDWPEELRDRDPQALNMATNELSEKIGKEKFLQYIFDRQWKSVKKYAIEKGIQIIGDIPIYVDYDSADAWTNPELFKLDENKKPYAVGGVPPDYFSARGQLWGNPVYNWDEMKERNYDWWIKRFERALELTDIVRLDHFRGLVAYWEVPSHEKTAINGKWVDVPTHDFFDTLLKRFVNLPVIAEDLGLITPNVREVMSHFGFPGMKVLLFAFGDDNPQNLYLPHMYEENCVAYTGTHDNNTVKGWFEHEATEEEKRRVFKYLDRAFQVDEINWEFIKLLMGSQANIVIIPIQDMMGLGVEARMNAPSTVQGNWRFRFVRDQFSDSIKERLLEITEKYGRD
jgi:4-alpha-glucanotransferase